MNAFKKHGVSILKELSVERMHSFALKNLIPTMKAKIMQGIMGADISEEEVLLSPQPAVELPQERKYYLQSSGLSKVSITTVMWWMYATGFQYKTEQAFFVDGHESPETLEYWPMFTKQYIAHKVQAHCLFNSLL